MTGIRIADIRSKVSFKQYWAGKACPGTSIPATLIEGVATGENGVDPRPRVLGLFFHDFVRTILELKPSKCQFAGVARSIFTDLCSEYALKEPSVSFRFDPTVSQIYESVRHHAGHLLDLDGEKKFEVPVESNDGSLWGIPDLVVVRGADISLIDFKLSGSRDRLDTERNLSQLAFYSYLVNEVYGFYPNDIRLIGLRGACLEVPLDLDLVGDVVGRSKLLNQTFQEAKRLDLSLEEISTPSAISCNHCPHSKYCGLSLAKG